MRSPLVRRCGIVVVFAGLLCAAAWWYGNASSEANSTPPESRAEADNDVATATQADPASSEPEAIEFPQEMWEPAGLRVQTVQSGTIADTVELTGKITLNEDRLAHVFPLVEGRVEDVRVQFGQRVRKGDLLLVVQSREVGQGMLQLHQDRLKLAFARTKQKWIEEVRRNTATLIEMMRAGASIDEIETALKDRTMGEYREKLTTAYVALQTAEAHLKRLAPLSPSGAVPARQVLEAESSLNAARATLLSLLEQVPQDTLQALRLAEQAVQELETSIAIAETNLKILGFDSEDIASIDPAKQGEALAHYPVTAPFDGTVISKDVVLMERVAPDRQILTIADLSSVWVTADIYESHLPLLARLSNQTVRLRCNAFPDKRFEARIFYTGDVVQESTRTVALRAIAANDEGLLKPGMFVTVELPSLDETSVLKVPLSAIQDHEGKSFVFVQTGDESFTRQDVTLGRRTLEFVEVRSGLEQDDRVVVAGGFALKSRMLADLLEE